MNKFLTTIWLSHNRTLKTILLIVVISPLVLLAGSIIAHSGYLAAVGILGILFAIFFFIFAARYQYIILFAIILAAFCLDYLRWIFGLPEFVSWFQPMMVGILLYTRVYYIWVKKYRVYLYGPLLRHKSLYSLSL